MSTIRFCARPLMRHFPINSSGIQTRFSLNKGDLKVTSIEISIDWIYLCVFMPYMASRWTLEC